MTSRSPLDPNTADRLVSGSLAPDDAPPGYGQVAQLLSDAKPTAHHPAQPAQLDALLEVILTAADPSGRHPTRRSSMLARLLTVKAVAVVGAVTLGVTAAGAATGSLPHAVQGAAHHALAKVGVAVPDPDDDVTTPADQSGDNQGDHKPVDTPVANQPGASNDPGTTPVADQTGDNQGDNNQQGDTPAAGQPDETQGDNNQQDDTPAAGQPDETQGDNNQQDDISSADQPSDNHQQGDAPSADQPSDNQGDQAGGGN